MTLTEQLQTYLADNYALYLKSHNYHYHVTGTHFKERHTLFEEQYTELVNAIDAIAERIVTLGGKAPTTFNELNKRKRIPDPTGNENAEAMVTALRKDHEALATYAREVVKAAEEADDPVTADLLTGRAAVHEKTAWMLRSLETA